MDANQAVADLLRALSCNDRDSAAEAATALADWLEGGGCIPDALAANDAALA